MNVVRITNFKLGRKIDLGKTIKIIWRNTKNIKDLKLRIVKSSFPGFDKEFNLKINKSWMNLGKRAKKLFPVKGPFRFYNQKDIRWEGIKGNKISVSKGINYKMISSIRSNQKLYSQMDPEKSPRAFVVVSILISKDNKIILGKRKYYGDWQFNTYECPGAFLHEEDLKTNSLIKSAREKVRKDYVTGGAKIAPVPFAIYYLPRILEVVLICVSTIHLTSEQLHSSFYSDVIAISNTVMGYKQLQKMPPENFHPPSRVALEFYFKHLYS